MHRSKRVYSLGAISSTSMSLAWLEKLAQPVWAFWFALLLYLALAWLNGSPWETSTYSYFNYLADAFLHGQLHLRLVPPITHDLVAYQGNYYLYWPPFPAVLLLPFVALFGVGFSDILFTVLIGSANVAVVAALLQAAGRQGLFRLTGVQRALLVLFFAAGTVHITQTARGNVWSTALVIGFLCVGLAYLSALTRRGWTAFALAGLAMACALTTRNHLLFAGIWPAWFLLRQHWQLRWRKLAVLALAGAAPVIVAGVLLLLYNQARFGSPFDVGLDYHQMAGIFVEDYARYGAFHLHYLPTNFYYQYLYYPLPLREDSLMGGSLFLLSPVFLAALVGAWRHRKEPSTWLLVLTILAVNIPILLLMGTGWVQFGPRYTLDFTVPLLLLTAIGIQDWKVRLLGLLVLISVVHYVAGVLLLFKLT